MDLSDLLLIGIALSEARAEHVFRDKVSRTKSLTTKKENYVSSPDAMYWVAEGALLPLPLPPRHNCDRPPGSCLLVRRH